MNSKETAVIALIIFLTVVAWIAFGLYHAAKTSSITSLQQEQIKPLTPNFDGAIIEKIKSRER